ncbi:DivIVA domain-containing protein [Pseudoflavonifractor sp. 524-17]|uniref:DivIVA domain-containing protein n=1 Tax=Pseudoflavonifractor sp. 524-17 TaxID=2304577 RepID=UPI00137AF104|nr:DivIVA domain-containing protein [Pseudoflavonifractor sp. 524-17]NCE63632.1 DivIVA domain-containing protein [Pseudoflavonifractor sp. 524-17]
MMTPQEVSEHVFDKASFGGYNMAMVDEFLDALTEDYTTLYKENTVLKSKMKVLVDKVEEYRSTEDAMRKALLTAQRLADDMVAEAQSKRDELIRSAESEAVERHKQLMQDIASEELRLTAARQSTSEYLSQLKQLCQHEMEYLSGLGHLAAPSPQEEAAQAIEHAVSEAVRAQEPPRPPAAPKEDGGRDSLYAELIGLSTPPAAPQPEPPAPAVKPPPPPQEEEDMDSSPTKRIDFSNLQFGKDYEIK